jgi:uncharacterized protein YjbI with pentapeptide repeats
MLSAVARSREPGDLRVMPWWLALLGLLVAVGLGWLVLELLLTEADRATAPDARAGLRIDAIRTGLTVVAGTGGGMAFLLAARRQWISERAQRHQETVAARDHAHRERIQAHTETVAEATARQQEQQARAVEHDAAERRLTEQYGRGVELLGSDRPAVRLGGLHALERLGQDSPGQRPAVAAVLCAYLRMPAEQEDPRETEVRRTAHRILTRHLRAADPRTHWPRVRLELAGARLVDFDAAGCTLVDADLTGAELTGVTSFAGAVLVGRLALGATLGQVDFTGLTGDGELLLDGARITGRADFTGATLSGPVSARDAVFAETSFVRATFGDTTVFDRARFTGPASFRRTSFARSLSLERAEFQGHAGFRSVTFGDLALFRWTVFGGDALFERARFVGPANFGRAEFRGLADFTAAVGVEHRIVVDHARALAGTENHVWPPGVLVQRQPDDSLLLLDP